MTNRELAKELRKQGLTYREIGERLGVSTPRAQQYIKGNSIVKSNQYMYMSHNMNKK